MQERRQTIRLQCELPTRFRNLDSSASQAISDAVVVNISRQGICIRVDEFVPLHSHLYIYISLPSRPTIEARVAPAWVAELPHSGQYEIGTHFVEIRPEDEETIQNYQFEILLDKMPRRKFYPKDL